MKPASNAIHTVTGAFGFTGKYIAMRLIKEGRQVRTLTGSPDRPHPFNGAVRAFPFDFDRPERLVESLKGTEVLYNNYWVRFNHRGFTYKTAVDNSRRLFEAASRAGVGRIVHISITNPSEDSPFEYFRGKAVLERELRSSGLPHTILRPAVIFGREDILVNNIVWFLRRFPVFGVFGKGDYRLEPIYVDDLASLAVAEGGTEGNGTIDAVGPERYTYRGLAAEIAKGLGLKRKIVSIPPALGYAMGRFVGALVGDVTITRDEIEGLMADLLYTGSPPAGVTRLSGWVRENASTVGRIYMNELERRYARTRPY